MTGLSIPYRGDTVLTAALDRPKSAPKAILVLAHGSSAEGKDHPLLAAFGAALSSRHIACLRFDFPFVTQGKTTPNNDAVLDEAFTRALEYACAHFPGIPVIAAGKSSGARAAARVTIALARPGKRLPEGMRPPDGALFLTYPLHPAGKIGVPADTPAAHCPRPMLFIQGTRDAFANTACMREFVTGALASRAGIHFIEGGDHALRGCGKEPEAIIAECAARAADFLGALQRERRAAGTKTLQPNYSSSGGENDS